MDKINSKHRVTGIILIILIILVGFFLYRQMVEKRVEKTEIPETSCFNECFCESEKVCAENSKDNNQYKVCEKDDDNCLKWVLYTCPAGYVCQDDQCVEECVSRYTKKCNGNSVYWYDSCSKREEKVQDCGVSNWTNEYQCSLSRYLQRKWINRGCSNGQCFVTSEWRTFQDCGVDSWTNNYRCSGNWLQREKAKKGCLANSCYSYALWENWKNCAAENKICQNNKCVAPPVFTPPPSIPCSDCDLGGPGPDPF